MNINQVREIKTNPQISNLIADYLILDAKLQVIGPQVEKIQNDLLKKYRFHKKNRDGSMGELITDSKILYRAVEDTENYYTELNQKIMKESFSKDIKDGNCPKLTLEHQKIMIEKEVVDIVAETFHIYNLYDLEARKEIFNITMRFVS